MAVNPELSATTPTDASDVPPVRNMPGLIGLIVSVVGLLLTLGVACPAGAIISAFGLRRPPRTYAVAGLVVGAIGSVWLIYMIYGLTVGALQLPWA